MKKLLLILTAFITFCFSFAAYAVSYATIDISPNQDQIIPTNKPTVSVDWPYALGAHLKSAKVLLDGQDISKDVKLNSKGFIYKLPKKLTEGIHVVNVKLKYDLLYEKEVNLRWFFNTKTVPIKIT